jgi:transposase InsO family protein
LELLERGTRLVFESGRPIAHVAADLGVPAETLRLHVRRVEANEGRRSDLLSDSERLIKTTHARNYFAYGYRQMWKALGRAGEQVSRCRVQRLMRTHRIVGAKRRGKPWRTTRPDAQTHRHPDLVRRDFTASGPNQLWVADLSYLRCWQGVVFFAFVIDAFSRRVVGWQLASHMSPRWCWTRCEWRCSGATQAPTSSSCTTPTAARNLGSTGRRNAVLLPRS